LNTGSRNVFIGFESGFKEISGSGNIMIGYRAGYNETGSNKLYIANSETATPLIYGNFSTGNIGLGLTNPAGRIAIRNGTYGGLLIDVKNEATWLGSFTNIQTGNYAWGDNNTPSTLVLQGNGGDVSIGVLGTMGYKFYVNGTAYSTGGWASSDARWKTNIKPLQEVLGEIVLLQGTSFEWRQDEFPEMQFDKGQQIGLIAQEVEKIFPELVKTDNKGYKAVSYEKLSVLLVEGMKEQQQQITSQQEQIESQQKQIDELKSLVNNLMTGDK
jgi:hypothetical protein